MTTRELLALIVAAPLALVATWGIALALLTSEAVLDTTGPEVAATVAFVVGVLVGLGAWRLVAGSTRR